MQVVGIELRSSRLYKKPFTDCYASPAPNVKSLNSSSMLCFGFLEYGYALLQISSVLNLSVAFGSFCFFHILKSPLSAPPLGLLQLP